ncbi:MAG: lysophospholipid acyltransferase family protein [Fimbriimonadales bacterium]
MASRTKRIKGAAGTAGFAVAERTFRRMEPVRAEKAGARLGMTFYRLFKSRRKRMLSNLALAMPELSAEDRLDISRRCAQHFGRVFADFLRTTPRTEKEVLDTCPIVDVRYFEEALAGGKGMILITGHFGNWERAAESIVAHGFKLTVVARDANDGAINQALLRIREAHGVEVLSRGNAARGILRKLAQNEIVGILPDQNSGDMFVPFFGQPCGTVTGPASIHLKTGAPLVPFFCHWVSPNLYEGRAYPHLEAVPGYEPVEALTRAINNAVEAAIREHPEQWLWFHDRWKSARKAGLVG